MLTIFPKISYVKGKVNHSKNQDENSKENTKNSLQR